MRLFLFILTIAAGAGTAFTWLMPGDADNRLAVVMGVGKSGKAEVAQPDRARPAAPAVTVHPQTASETFDRSTGWPRFFGFPVSLGNTERAAPGPSAPSAIPTPEGRMVVADASAPAAHQPAAKPWSTDVVRPADRREAQQPTVIAPAIVVTALPAPAGAVRDLPRHELARELQRELRRVGCYGGETDGSWGVGSKRSMRAFLDRVGSTLPSEEPDLIQLTLVRGHAGGACRSGNGTVTAGVPTNAPSSQPSAYPSSATVRGQHAVPLAAPPAPRTPSLAQTAPAPLPAPVIATSQPLRAAPLEGRMSVGGPTMPSPDNGPPPGSLTAPPVAAPAAPQSRERYARQRPSAGPGVAAPRPQAAPPRRSERSWTATFFDR